LRSKATSARKGALHSKESWSTVWHRKMQLRIESDDELEPALDEMGGTTGPISRWRNIAVVSTLTVVVLCAMVPLNFPMNSVIHGENLKHVTDLGAIAEKKDDKMGFPIYFTGGLGIQAAGKRWLITFKEEAKDQKNQVAKKLGDKVLYSGSAMPILEVECSLGDLKDALKNCKPGEVDFAEQDGRMGAIPEVTDDPPPLEPHPSERRLDKQENPPSYGLDRIDERDLPLDKGFQPHNDFKDGEGVHVYVVDTGIRTSHEDFGGRAIPTLETFGRSVKECNGDKTCAGDGNGHGTHCAGTVAGKKYGVAKKAKVHAVKVFGDNGFGSSTTVVRAMDWMITNAEKPAVASMSLGGRGKSPTQERLVDGLTEKGITVVVAAGNSNDDACNYSPAHAANAITVGSTTERDDRSGFSNFGTCIDMFAPGSHIKSAGSESNTHEETLSGTSMACPHVAGAVALLLGQSPNKKPQQLTAELIKHSTPNSLHDVKGSPNKLLYVGSEGDAPTPAPRPPLDDCSSKGWKVTEGMTELEIDQNCCLKTKGDSGEYRKDVTAKVQVGSSPGLVETVYFKTEAAYDGLTVRTPGQTPNSEPDEHTFSGSENVVVHPKANSVIEWVSDYSVQDKGFKLCMKKQGSCPSNGWKPEEDSTCRPSYTYDGNEYSGCTTVDYDGKGWCVQQHRRRRRYWVNCETC